jgi:VWFA-related protein
MTRRVIGWLLLAAAAPPLAAQGTDRTGEPLEGLFGSVLDVRVVNVEAVVTDRDGVPVRGLAVERFRLEVDGESVPIEYFTEVRGGVAIEGKATGGSLADIPAVAPGEPVGTSYLVFIDEVFSVEEDRDRILASMAGDLGLLTAADRMAIVAFDGRRLDMLTSWSGSSAELERSLEGAQRRPAQGLQRLVERRQFEGGRSLPPTFSRRGPFDGLDPDARAYALRLADQVDRVVRAASATLRGFAQPPGRKVMLLLSGGWPFRPSDFVAGERRIVTSDDLDLAEGEELFRGISDTANRLGYTLYAVHVPGPFDRLDETVAGGRAAAVRRQDLQTTARYLARETGGAALLGLERERAFRDAVADTRSYYWLGFTPDRSWDDRHHEIRVRVEAPGLEVRSRNGFHDVSRQAEVSMAVESALFFGGPGAPELEVELGEPRKAGFRKVEVPLRISMPLAALTLLEQGERWVGALEVRFAVVDAGFHQAPVPVLPVTIERTAAPGPEERWELRTALKLRRRPHTLLVAVYDPASGRIFTREVGLDL